MSEWLEMFAALLLVLSPLWCGALCAGAQVLLARWNPALPAVLPLCAVLLFAWFPEGGSWLFRGFYFLNCAAALMGSLAGAPVGWLMRRERRRPCTKHFDNGGTYEQTNPPV